MGDRAKKDGGHAAAIDSGNKMVVIGFGEALSAPEVAWNLLDAGFRVAAFTRQGCRPPLRRIGNVMLFEVIPPEEDAFKAVEGLVSGIERMRADALLPLDDASLWLCDAVSSKLHVPVAGPTGENARLALDKRLQVKAATDAGFRVPATQEVRSVREALQTEDFPVVLKPALAVAEVGGKLCKGRMHVCANRNELEGAVKAWGERQPMLFQPLLLGTGEGLFGFAVETSIANWSAHRRIRMMNPQGSGSSACRSVPITDQPVECSERMLKTANWSGMFMIELLRDSSNRIWFMELNGRSWGSMALALRLGLEYPAWTVLQTLDPTFIPPAAAPRGPIVCRHLGREIVHVLMVLRGSKSAALRTSNSRLRTLYEVCRLDRRDRWYNYRPGNKLLFLEDACGTVFERIISGLRAS
jgi:predicted ATP-grasp superfamily ATP-dependent carboligase